MRPALTAKNSATSRSFEVATFWLFAPAFFWEDVVSMLVLALHTAYLGALVFGWLDARSQMLLALAAYASRYQAGQNWYFLTGSNDTLQMLSRYVFKLSDLGLTHSTRFVLVDGKGRIRGYYGTADDSTIRNLLSDVRQLQKELGGRRPALCRAVELGLG